MKKTLIALAVAGVVAAPAAFAATSNVDVYGNLGVSYDFIDTDAAGDDKLNRVSSNSSRIGFKGSEDLGGGLAGVWQIESQLNMDGVGASNAFTGASNFSTNLRNSFLGLSSKTMGTLVAGIHDTPYKMSTGKAQVWGDSSADFNNIVGNVGGSTHFDLRTGNTIVYISPSFSGLSGAVAYVEGKEVNNGAAHDDSGYSAMVAYDQGPLFLSAAYEKHNLANDRDAFKLAGAYTFGNSKLGLIYEKADNAAGTHDRDAWYLNGSHKLGNIVLKAAYGRAGDAVANDGAKTWSLGADYNLSKRSYMYGYYTSTSNDSAGTYSIGNGQGSFNAAAAGSDPSVFSIGMRHTF